VNDGLFVDRAGYACFRAYRFRIICVSFECLPQLPRQALYNYASAKSGAGKPQAIVILTQQLSLSKSVLL
jgi:hypothetical protein